LLQPPDFYLHDVDVVSHDGRFACEVIRTIQSAAQRLTLVKLDHPPAEGEDIVALTERESDSALDLPITEPHDVFVYWINPTVESAELVDRRDLRRIAKAVISPV